MEKIGNYRWTICGLVFFATTINYLDRQVISLLKSTLSEELNWNDGDYANIEIAFKLFYAFGMLGAGRLVDKLGTKIGYAVATTLWSIAAVAHALVNTVFGFALVRSALGITEAGNFPAAIKTVAEWFPKKERAFATGIFNSGTNFGAIIAPLSVPFIAAEMGWQWAFIITGMLGFVWLVLWLVFYEVPSKSPKLSKAEYDYIHSDAAEVLADKNDVNKPQVSWFKLLSYRQTWAFAIGKLLTDPIWWFYLFWLPDFLQSQYKLTGTQIAIPVAVVYTLSTFGSVLGGYLPMYLIKIGWPVFRARKTSMLIYALCVSPIIFSQILGSIDMWYAVCVIGFAAAAHQAWSANIFTTVSDMFPKYTTASVTGIGGMFGALGGILLSALVQKNMFVYYRSINQIETAYYIMFFVCGAAYVLAWTIMHFLVPKMKPVDL
ncbi:MFS transporter [Runella slithyformis]|uniref:Major facilitator superfamily MFS_1 n=1 Tax=Runella slithyformis (strain ATCC 29530 / DSM 19594 / LMG 11500 / NCIMB 11436 / LSU 4) TaxID=761193 RepID=A0A7U3ZK84_RUNSL|nr:MFS transporter [Runella slithyformis]AEI48698.1 major facilitator superfamily MFS_1 [Runella slithyformis DSM 19594]